MKKKWQQQQKKMYKGQKVGSEPRKHNMRIFWDREIVISNVIEFGWNLDIFLNLFQLSTEQKTPQVLSF